jgi:predicted RNA methylase
VANIDIFAVYTYGLSFSIVQAENSFGDISNKIVADLGCGCGTLGLAALLLDAG